MGTLSDTATISLDGYAADSDGDVQWSAPGDEVFAFHVDRVGVVSHEVLGRNTYRLMTYWTPNRRTARGARTSTSSPGGGAASTARWCPRPWSRAS